jgi:hypothetical protein
MGTVILAIYEHERDGCAGRDLRLGTEMPSAPSPSGAFRFPGAEAPAGETGSQGE